MEQNKESNVKPMEKASEKVTEKVSEKMMEQVTENKITSDVQSTSESSSLKKKKHIWLWILLAIVAILIGVYCYIANYYKTRFFRNTSINNMDCSDMRVSEVADRLAKQAQEYHIEIIGRNENGEEITLGTILASDMDYAYTDTEGSVSAILEQQNGWLWITMLGNNTRNYSLIQGSTYDSELLKKSLKSLEAFQTKNMVAPTDAYIGEYSEETGTYEIIPESVGTKLNVNAAISCVEAAIIGDSSETSARVNLVEQGCYEEPEITSDDKKLVENVNTINKWLGTEITYNWNESEVIVDTSVIKDWVSFENGKPVLDEEAVAEFVKENAEAYDTFGKSTTFTTALGIDVTLKRRSYGWKTDKENEAEALIALIYDGAKEEREPLYARQGVWKGQQDVGTSYVEADLTHQHLYVFENGNITFETDFVSGNINKSGCVTPSGIFGLTYKTRNAVLRGDNYETPVSYWMPFYGNFGMHDATWRSSFGGEIYMTNGSHGCINLPLDSAAQIYNYVSEGSPIICYYY